MFTHPQVCRDIPGICRIPTYLGKQSHQMPDLDSEVLCHFHTDYKGRW